MSSTLGAALSLATVQAWLARDDQTALRHWLEAQGRQEDMR